MSVGKTILSLALMSSSAMSWSAPLLNLNSSNERCEPADLTFDSLAISTSYVTETGWDRASCQPLTTKLVPVRWNLAPAASSRLWQWYSVEPLVDAIPALGSVSFALGQAVLKQEKVDELLRVRTEQSSRISLSMEYSTKLFDNDLTLVPMVSRTTLWTESESGSRQALDTYQQVHKEELTLSYGYPLTSSLGYSTYLYGIWSSDRVGNAPVSVVNDYALHGFEFVQTTGSEGYFWRNDFHYDLGDIQDVGTVMTVFSVDMGQIGQDRFYTLANDTVVGAALSVMLAHPRYETTLSLGLPVDHPSEFYTDQYTLYYWFKFKL